MSGVLGLSEDFDSPPTTIPQITVLQIILVWFGFCNKTPEITLLKQWTFISQVLEAGKWKIKVPTDVLSSKNSLSSSCVAPFH